MTIKSLAAPSIGEAGVKRLIAFAAPKRLTSSSTLFDAGYEQAKRDFADKLKEVADVPSIKEPEPIEEMRVGVHEARARAASASPDAPWWHRMFK